MRFWNIKRILMKIAFPFQKQLCGSDCGPACLSMVVRSLGTRIYYSKILNLFNLDRQGVSIKEICDVANKLGYSTRAVKISVDQLTNRVPFPCIINWNFNHFVVVYKARSYRTSSILNRHQKHRSSKYFLADPASSKVKVSKKELQVGFCSSKGTKSEGYAILFEKTSSHKNNINDLPLQGLRSFLGPYKKALHHIIISLLMASILSLVFPIFTQLVFDQGIEGGDKSFVLLLLVSQFLIMFALAINNTIKDWLILYISSQTSISLVSDFLNKTLKQSFEILENTRAGDLVQRIGDHNRINLFLNSALISIVFSFIILVLYSIFLIAYHFQIFLAFLLGSLLQIIWIFYFLKVRERIDNQRFKHSSSSLNQLYQILLGATDIKLNNSEKSKVNNWIITQTRLFKTNVLGQRMNQYLSVGGALINQTKNLIISIIAIYAIIDGNMTIGTFVAIQYILGQLNGPITQLTSLIKSGQDASLSWKRLNNYIGQNSHKEFKGCDIKTPSEYAFKLEKISYKYHSDSEKPSIQNINITIPRDKTTAIIGASGSGKTTLLKLLIGIYTPSQGKVYFQGEDLMELDKSKLYKDFGIIVQSGYIFNDTIKGNLTMDNHSVSMVNLVDSCKVAQIHDNIIDLREGYSTQLGPKGHNFSVGQKQRLLIARALAKNPCYLFLDEATNSIDSATEMKIIKSIKKKFHNKTIIIVSHSLGVIKNADNIIVLRNGRIVEQGTHNTLLMKKQYYYKLIKEQILE